MNGGGDVITWPEVVVAIGLFFGVLFLVGIAVSTFLELRKTKVLAGQEAELRQLAHRYEQLAENTLDTQKRIAADMSEMLARTAAIEQILRSVE